MDARAEGVVGGAALSAAPLVAKVIYGRASSIIILPGELLERWGRPSHVDVAAGGSALRVAPLKAEGEVVKVRARVLRRGATPYHFITLPRPAREALAGAGRVIFTRSGSGFTAAPRGARGAGARKTLAIPQRVFEEMGAPRYIAVRPAEGGGVELTPLRVEGEVRKLFRVPSGVGFAVPRSVLDSLGRPPFLLAAPVEGGALLWPHPLLHLLPRHRWRLWVREAALLPRHLSFSCPVCGAGGLPPLEAALHAAAHGFELPAGVGLREALLHLLAAGALEERVVLDEEAILSVIRARLAGQLGSHARIYLTDIVKQLSLKPGRGLTKLVRMALEGMRARGTLESVDGWRFAGFGRDKARGRGFVAFLRSPPGNREG